MAGVKITGLKDIANLLNPKKMGKVVRNTINGTATAVRKLSIDLAAETYNIKKSRIRKDSKGRDTSFIRRARAGEDEATIFYKGMRPNLKEFSPNKSAVNRRGGLKFRLKRSDPLEVLERGFFTSREGGARFAAQRYEGTRQGKRKDKILVRSFDGETGPSIKQMVEDPDVFSKIEARRGRIFTEKFNVQMAKIFGR